MRNNSEGSEAPEERGKKRYEYAHFYETMRNNSGGSKETEGLGAPEVPERRVRQLAAAWKRQNSWMEEEKKLF
jgi:hypothetical protein